MNAHRFIHNLALVAIAAGVLVSLGSILRTPALDRVSHPNPVSAVIVAGK